MSKPVFEVNKQSLIDFEIKKDGETIGWISKNYANEKNSGPYYYKGIAFNYGDMFDKSFNVAKKFVMEHGTKRM